MKPTTIPSKLSSEFASLLFCIYICGHQRKRQTASNLVNLFLFSIPTTGIIVTPFSAVATQPTLRVLVALFLLLLVLALVPATFYRDQPRLCSTPIRSTCFSSWTCLIPPSYSQIHHNSSVTRYGSKQQKLSSATMRNKMNCAVMTRAIFFEPLRSGAMCVTHQVSQGI